MEPDININDIALEMSPDFGLFDIAIQGSDFKQAVDLKTAIVLSVFSDGRSNADDRVPNSRGWCGDSLNLDGEQLTGSKIWLLTNGKLTNQTLTDVEEYARVATQWIIDKQIAKEMEFEATFLNKSEGRIALRITVTEPKGNVPQEYVYVWNQVKAEFKGLI